MEFKPTDFVKMLCNPYALADSKDMFVEFPNVFKYAEFKVTLPMTGSFPALTIQKILRYICYAYDKNSPLHKENDLLKRKYLACELAKISKKEGQSLIGETDDTKKEENNKKINVIAPMIIRYIRLQKHLEYATLVAMLEGYWNNISLVMSKDVFDKDGDVLKDATAKSKLNSTLLENLIEIKSLTNKVFYGDEELLYEVDDIVINDMSGIPEMMVEKIKNGTI